MIIYIDIFLLENFFMYYIVLIGTSLVSKNKLKQMKLLISAFIGGMFSVFKLMVIIPIVLRVLIKIIISILMVEIAFYPHNVKKMLKLLVVFYLITFTTGGCAFGIVFLINPNNISEYDGTIIVNHPYKISILAGIIGFIIIQYSFYNNKRKIQTKDYICNIKIRICGELVKTKAFIDSGNNLKDPITKEPVIIIEKNVLTKVFNIDNLETFNSNGGDYKLKIRWIPYKSIGKNKGALIGVKAEKVEIEFNEEYRVIENVTVGIYNKKINNKYSALVGIDFINKDES